MSEIEELLGEVNKFREERDWRKFHNEKDLALSIVLESAELLELFQWKSAEDVVQREKENLSDELADVLIYCFMLADNLGLDPAKIIREKMRANAEKYPVEKSYGRSDKYTDLD